MRYSSLERGFQPGNPIASALVIIVGSIVIAASIVVGFFAFVIVGSLLLVVAAVISLRLWWFRRKMERDPTFPQQGAERADVSRQTIEGEYRVVIEEKENRPRG